MCSPFPECRSFRWHAELHACYTYICIYIYSNNNNTYNSSVSNPDASCELSWESFHTKSNQRTKISCVLFPTLLLLSSSLLWNARRFDVRRVCEWNQSLVKLSHRQTQTEGYGVWEAANEVAMTVRVGAGKWRWCTEKKHTRRIIIASLFPIYLFPIWLCLSLSLFLFAYFVGLSCRLIVVCCYYSFERTATTFTCTTQSKINWHHPTINTRRQANMDE